MKQNKKTVRHPSDKKPCDSHGDMGVLADCLSYEAYSKVHGALLNLDIRCPICKICDYRLAPRWAIDAWFLYRDDYAGMQLQEFLSKMGPPKVVSPRTGTGGMTGAVQSHSSTHTPTQGRKR